ncbi:MAG: DUF4956 domain-containing protein [Nitrospinota bacterium]|nr:DUF4956 domain-containing protein [Nitrospinota bacterium]
MLGQLNLPEAAPLSIPFLIINLGIGTVMALLLRWHFVRFGSTLSNRRQFAQIFPFILLTTTLIITIVKSSLALSLGLVGALSIVRFRTPIKEPEELAYLFMAIAMGLGLGANQTLPTVVSGVVILSIMALLHSGRRKEREKNLYLSLNWKQEPGKEHNLDSLNKVLNQHVFGSDLRRLDSREDTMEATYFVEIESPDKLSNLVDNLQQVFPGIGVTFIDQNQIPSV